MPLFRLTPAALALLAACATAPAEQEPQASRSTPIGLDASQVAVIQEGVRGVLKDPESARFGAITASQALEGGVGVCGYVNSRKSFGGFTGETPFAGLLGSDFFIIIGFGGNETEDKVVRTICERTLGIHI